jgi:predicted flap endonuclease-1-like 5' DNA nuclease
VTRHIEFCLDEIECEIEAIDEAALGPSDKLCLSRHVAGMRALLQSARSEPAETRHRSGLLASVAPVTDDLALIRGIGDRDIALLAERRIQTFSAIATWRREDIVAVGGRDFLRRVARENWIEQAAILATGDLTHHAEAVIARRFAEQPVAALADALASVSAVMEEAVERSADSHRAMPSGAEVVDLASAGRRRRSGAPLLALLVAVTSLGADAGLATSANVADAHPVSPAVVASTPR